MLSTSVVLPTFNERDNILTLITAIQQALPTPEILVVDDNSPDGTWQLVQERAAQDSSIRVIRRTAERGLTSAIQRGIDEARGEIVFWMDCDFSMPPQTMPAMLREIAHGADVAIGSRYARGGKDARGDWLPIAFSAVINLASKICLGWRSPVRDFTTGFVSARKAVFQQIRLQGDYGEYCIDLLVRAHRKGFRIAEVGYVCKPRSFGESKTAPSFMGFIRRGRKYVTTILRLMIQR